jgi:hypothetical protein
MRTGRWAGFGVGLLAGGFSLVCGWAFAGEVMGSGHPGAGGSLGALALVAAAALVLLRAVSAEERRLAERRQMVSIRSRPAGASSPRRP